MTSHELTIYYIRVAMATGVSKQNAKLFASAMVAGKHSIDYLTVK